MTKREMFEKIAGMVDDVEVKEFCASEIEKMNVRNAKRAERPSKTAIANEPIKAKIMEFLNGCEEREIASTIATEVEISVQKASSLCGQLVKDGRLSVEDVKVKGKGKVKGYKVV